MIDSEDTFNKRWQEFLKACHAPDQFTRGERSLAFAFYIWGSLDATKAEAEARKTELSELGLLITPHAGDSQ